MGNREIAGGLQVDEKEKLRRQRILRRQKLDQHEADFKDDPTPEKAILLEKMKRAHQELLELEKMYRESESEAE